MSDSSNFTEISNAQAELDHDGLTTKEQHFLTCEYPSSMGISEFGTRIKYALEEVAFTVNHIRMFAYYADTKDEEKLVWLWEELTYLRQRIAQTNHFVDDFYNTVLRAGQRHSR